MSTEKTSKRAPDYKNAMSMAQKVLDASFITEPPVDVYALAESNGLQLKIVDFSEFPNICGAIILIKNEGDPIYDSATIMVSHSDPVARQRFTVAHELGHWILHKAELIAQP